MRQQISTSARANIGTDGMAGDILKHSLQMPLGITCLRRHIIQRKRLIQ